MFELSTVKAVESIASTIFTRKDARFVEDVSRDIKDLEYVLKDLLDSNSFLSIKYKLGTIRDKVIKNEVDLMLDILEIAGAGKEKDG